MFLKRTGSFVAAVLYFFAAHIYDGLCYTVSNLFSYPVAICLMSAVLFSLSTSLVILHDRLEKCLAWDILQINEINRLVNTNSIAQYKLSQRFTRWIIRKGRWWVHIVGSFTIGPPIVTLILREKNNLKFSLFYLGSGTLISVLTWVTVWSGVGKLTWNQLIKPLLQTVINSLR